MNALRLHGSARHHPKDLPNMPGWRWVQGLRRQPWLRVAVGLRWTCVVRCWRRSRLCGSVCVTMCWSRHGRDCGRDSNCYKQHQSLAFGLAASRTGCSLSAMAMLPWILRRRMRNACWGLCWPLASLTKFASLMVRVRSGFSSFGGVPSVTVGVWSVGAHDEWVLHDDGMYTPGLRSSVHSLSSILKRMSPCVSEMLTIDIG